MTARRTCYTDERIRSRHERIFGRLVLPSKFGGVELGAIAIETDVLQDGTGACCDHAL